MGVLAGLEAVELALPRGRSLGARPVPDASRIARDLAKAQGEANLLAWSAAAGKDQVPLDPGATVMDQLRVAVMRADLYGELLRVQVEDQDYAGLVGPTFAAGRDGARVETGEQVRGSGAVGGGVAGSGGAVREGGA